MPARVKSLYSKVYEFKNLFAAWETVKKNGRLSQSDETRKSIEDFENGAKSKLKKIRQSLKSKTFLFKKPKGVAIKRKGKEDRPIVVAPVENRIVQRALLNVLQKEKEIKKLTHQPNSFGGLEKKSVEDAFRAVVAKYNSGAKFYARSDIVSFFRGIPKDDVLKKMFSVLPLADEDFKSLLTNAVNTELSNLEALGEKVSLFPLDDTGVAQGSCLSPLLGNIFLHEFDLLSNTKDICCIRFIDDYVILGPSVKGVKSVFKKGKEFLRDHGLEVYDPFLEKGKGKIGPISQPYDFLGCEVHPGRISPSKKSIENFKDKIKKKIHEGLKLNNGETIADTIVSIRNKVQGWGSSYSFCNNNNLELSLDEWLNKEIAKYYRDYHNQITKMKTEAEVVASLGMKYLASCKKDPIYGAKSVKRTSRKSKLFKLASEIERERERERIHTV